MPWWGQAYGGGACQCVCETPWDGGYALQHEPGGETAVCSAWYPSLGRMAYRRKCRFYFFRGGDYNAMCLNYRRIVERRGELLTLREKNRPAPPPWPPGSASRWCTIFFSSRWISSPPCTAAGCPR